MNRTGFTLIELLIVLAIIGILVGIAYPTYQHHILKVRRINAIVSLNDLAAQMEQYYNVNHSYKGVDIKVNNKFYRFEIEAADTTYVLKAIPIGSADTQCGTLELDQVGHKTITGTGNTTNCWI